MLRKIFIFSSVFLTGAICGLIFSRLPHGNTTMGLEVELFARNLFTDGKQSVRASQTYKDINKFGKLVEQRLERNTTNKPDPNVQQGAIAPPLNIDDEEARTLMELLK